MAELAQRAPKRGGFLESRFGISAAGSTVGTEVRAGLATFMVMAYIIFVNPSVLSFRGIQGLENLGLAPEPTLTVTCLTAGILTILMGYFTNYPFALAPGMGLNAFVAFTLVAGLKLTWPQAMTVILLEGAIITLLVLTRFREAIMNAIPMSLKVSIGVGIGLFIALIGLVNAGFVRPGGAIITLGNVQTTQIAVFGFGLLVSAWMLARKVKGALLYGIVLSTILALVLEVARLPTAWVGAPNLSTFGRVDFGFIGALGALTAALVVFSVMLSDFFDTMGTVIGIGGEGGFLDRGGQLPRIDRVLLVDSLGALFGGFANASSNTTYIESAAGVAEGGRTGLVSIVVGVLFLLAMVLNPIAGMIPAQATAPALVLVGFFMMTLVKSIPWQDYEEAIPSFVTMIVMPATYSITNGIGAGFITYAVIKLLSGKSRDVHWLMWLVAAAFVVYFVWGKH